MSTGVSFIELLVMAAAAGATFAIVLALTRNKG